MANRDSFGSKFGIIAAAAGSAVGLGNIWKFPYVAGENGGGAFLVIYLFFVLVIGVPVMMSEFAIGRRGQKNAYGSFKALAPGGNWHFVGFMGVVAAFFILAFYSAVAGWTLEYIVLSVKHSFAGQTPQQLEENFGNFLANPIRPIVWQLIFMILTAGIVLAGIKKGIEKYTKLLMPLLLFLIIVLCIRSVTLPGAGEGLAFLFKPNFDKVTAKTVLYALGQAFFSLSLGMGALITYSSYFDKKENLASTAVEVSLADTLIAILAGVMIFPAVFAFDIAPTSGPSLIFITLPGIFQQLPGGDFFGAIFFILLAVAALTSTISLLEVVVAFFSEELNITRKKATFIGTVAISVLGVFASMSFSTLSNFTIFGKNIFDLLDYAASNIMLPLGGLFIVLFVGWFVGRKVLRSELTNEGKLKASYYPAFIFIVKFIAPLAIAVIFIYSIFWGGLG
ncbi:MAG TPA: sodium-dependent transporter [Tenuifilaceae bacterium]|nr:sodium-dependent transporter [Tenuifilaceae bacterium]HPE18159.1 sodium-dependent transporter [Tenuifilaceae bacterium]HPJ46400.1 sodium-dependent transporter [Tenuifilaceae bacterium]HPQ35054.1 sodium-dependent transporter [Tenuifilaceae bacterium]